MTTIIITFIESALPGEIERFRNALSQYLETMLPQKPEYRDVRHPIGTRATFTITVRGSIGSDVVGLKSYINALQEELAGDGKIKNLIIHDIICTI
ncbi:MAG: hypothetical protein A2408_00790 [Candidatus Yonathbacteria bacterium RIFOXYC1_FULL_52_10]|uniref:Uncharacterized protein n=1 Tax=Candidatus Yonathbacteria bacterium RIFOXYD1_FULL_52_36 TaxID=1802730 RepID=A0A1G2SJG4_9BACT|nr:MAG: hypothetical protein A2408_00790 [Candidatus Yonathbacteria bacterium RIFOXYC1_FULL_52_10]OHA85217.1 MAG: hypothetical protein A2591_03935 [Candidatus Yonathbacteria bacterium RIFOXYD1_FULL_52_36]